MLQIKKRFQLRVEKNRLSVSCYIGLRFEPIVEANLLDVPHFTKRFITFCQTILWKNRRKTFDRNAEGENDPHSIWPNVATRLIRFQWYFPPCYRKSLGYHRLWWFNDAELCIGFMWIRGGFVQISRNSMHSLSQIWFQLDINFDIKGWFVTTESCSLWLLFWECYECILISKHATFESQCVCHALIPLEIITNDEYRSNVGIDSIRQSPSNQTKKGIRTNDKWSSVFDLSIYLKFHVELKLKLKQTASFGSSHKIFFPFQ